MDVNVEIRRGADRFTERAEGRLSQHGFSFGSHYHPERLAFGPMVCHDDHLLGRERGFDTHQHADLEIVTWVVSGSVVHTDGEGTIELPAGSCGVLSAGAGVQHSELASAHGPARFVQVWLTPDVVGRPPAHAHAGPAIAPGAGLVRVVGDGGPLTVGVAGAALDVARLDAGESLVLPPGERVHAFLTTGALLRSSLAEPLAAGDALLLTAQSGETPQSYELTAAVPTEILVWSFDR